MDNIYTEQELKDMGLRSVGKNVKVSRKCSIYIPETISIGDHSRIDDFCCLVGGEKGINIGSNVTIAHYCLLGGTGGITLKDFSGISSRVTLYSANGDYLGESLTGHTVPKKYLNIISGEIILNKHVLIGTNTTVLPSVVIGEGTAVGAHSLVTKSLDSWGVYAGVPVKRIKERKKDLLLLEKAYLKELAEEQSED
ncbi:acyltransferase [Peribacillus frigoritolerans]|uniref:acyltransferase n=1 Tax=Peribacillus frigoritolerans TaxID=450367 RepID=UPI0010592831|nr:acyltransferase [Peribacillus frigoritolerans]TDL76473.1 acyltransferase [Peribacillus frigoritolerans]